LFFRAGGLDASDLGRFVSASGWLRKTAVICGAVALAFTCWWLGGERSEDAPPSRAAASEPDRELEREPERVRAQRPALPPPRFAAAASPNAVGGRAPGGPGDLASPRTSSAIDPVGFRQIQAAHELASQMDVSAYLEKNAQLAEAKVDKLCDEANKLPKAPLYPKSERKADAGAFLAPRIDWDTEPQLFGALHLSEARIAGLDGEGWEERLGELDLAGLDFSWMKQLLAYDAWDLLSAGPPSKLRPGADFGQALPLYAFFIHWSKLRFAHAFRFGDFADASLEVRHVAALLDTQKVVLAQVIAVIILRNEERAFQVARARGLGAGTGWAPIASAEDLDRRRQLDRISSSFFLPGVSPKVMSRALRCVPAPCTAITEGAWSHASFGELSPEDTRGAFARIMQDSGCGGRMIERVAEGRTLSVKQAHEAYGGESPLTRF
jgi:hypothetical protein